VVRIDKPVTLLLPFHRYTLELSHRLLDSLGGVSRFLLLALADGLTLVQLAEVTGLSTGTLLQQLIFLEHHHFVTIDRAGPAPVVTLGERGAAMVGVQRLLAGFKPVIWLDAFTLKPHAIHLLTSQEQDKLIPIPGEVDFDDLLVLRLPERRRSYRHFEQTNRVRNVMSEDALVDLLVYFHGDRAELIAAEAAHWEHSLCRADCGDVAAYFPVAYDPHELVLRQRHGTSAPGPTLPAIALPILGLTYHFRQAEDFPWPVTVPPPRTEYVELATQRILPNMSALPAEDADLRDCVAVPALIEGQLPPGLADIVVSPGISVTLGTKRCDVPFELDHAELTRQLHQYEDVMLFSFNHVETKAVAT
jgi:hypothetical protein